MVVTQIITLSKYGTEQNGGLITVLICCRESSKIVDDKLKVIGKKFQHSLLVADAQGTEKLASNSAMMREEDLKPVDGTEDCHK